MRKTKYNARGATVEGTKFDSQLEAECYLHFRATCKKLGIELELQPEFELIPTQRPFKGCTLRRHTYTADFRIPMPEGDPDIVIDVKSTATAEKRDYVMNEKLMLFLKGILITRITSPNEAAAFMRSLKATHKLNAATDATFKRLFIDHNRELQEPEPGKKLYSNPTQT